MSQDLHWLLTQRKRCSNPGHVLSVQEHHCDDYQTPSRRGADAVICGSFESCFTMSDLVTVLGKSAANEAEFVLMDADAARGLKGYNNLKGAPGCSFQCLENLCSCCKS